MRQAMQSLQIALTAANVIVTLVFLLYASWRDHKTREVSNRVWVIYGPIALTLSLSELLFFEPSQLLLYGLSVGVTVGFAFLLFYSSGFGGADSKALMCIAISLPFAPVALSMPFLAEGLSPIAQYIYPITILGNSVFFAAATAIYMALRNVVWHKKNGVQMFQGTLASESLGKKFLAIITGYPAPVDTLKKRHMFPMEDLEDQTENFMKRKLVVFPQDEETQDKTLERLSNAVKSGKIGNFVWATPGLPMLIFVTLGLIVALTFGDIVWLLIRLILGA
jgi:preflagellin peptidase FlaK